MSSREPPEADAAATAAADARAEAAAVGGRGLALFAHGIRVAAPDAFVRAVFGSLERVADVAAAFRHLYGWPLCLVRLHIVPPHLVPPVGGDEAGAKAAVLALPALRDDEPARAAAGAFLLVERGPDAPPLGPAVYLRKSYAEAAMNEADRGRR